MQTFLAQAIINWIRSGEHEHTAFAGYQQRRDTHALRSFHNTVTVAADLRAISVTRSSRPTATSREAAARRGRRPG